ncbi:hypothetical protein GUJ93_ZPchr0008g11629 [Zizania palustris]|uniref:Uncharacterized protein n=1 Tax=Zizania palustris TaxID=103762 RepID=A0A8J5UVR5_ZIZPA|nr:hypothetical protein GUJ93_ZPchr0008g11629 [Zizania palustris]
MDDAGAEGAVVFATPDAATNGVLDRKYVRPEALVAEAVVLSRDVLRCSYARAKIMVSSNDSGCWSATSVCRGLPSPVMYNCICCGSVSVGSRHESAMNRALYSSTKPVRRSMAGQFA